MAVKSKPLNIKDPEAYRLARTLADQTGQTLTETVIEPLRDRLQRNVAGTSEGAGGGVVQFGVGIPRAVCRATGKQYLAVCQQGRCACPKAICACKTEGVGCRIVELGNVRGNIFTITVVNFRATGDQDSPVGEQSCG